MKGNLGRSGAEAGEEVINLSKNSNRSPIPDQHLATSLPPIPSSLSPYKLLAVVYNLYVMGKAEEQSGKREQREKIKETLLLAVKAAGVLSVALLAPNALKMFRSLNSKSPNLTSRVNRSRNRLIKQGLLKWQAGGYLRLTDKGEQFLRISEAKSYALKRPNRWDKKWRILVFDIPEYRHSLRDKIRNILGSIGFIRLQNSVWVYPYDCEDFITLLKADLKVGKDLLYVIADSIENDRQIRTKFGLTND